jgi:hypothetical protein
VADIPNGLSVTPPQETKLKKNRKNVFGISVHIHPFKENHRLEIFPFFLSVGLTHYNSSCDKSFGKYIRVSSYGMVGLLFLDA